MGIISDYFEYLSFIPLITLVIVFLVYREKRINSILSCWADKEGVEIIRRTSGFFRASPFFFTLGHQEVFYLQLRDREGRERACWVRLGDFLFGVFFDRSVEAKWEKSDPSDSTGISNDSHALD